MRKILIDNIDKRMTAPLVDYLTEEGYEVSGVAFTGSAAISNRLRRVFLISKENIKSDVSKVFSNFSEDDCLLVGNPLIIEAVNEIKPKIKHIVPNQQTISKVTDKRRLMEFARNLGISVPKSDSSEYPLIIKLNDSENTGLKPEQRYKIVNSDEEYRKALDLMGAGGKLSGGADENILVQQYVTGNGFGVSMLLDRDSNLADYIMHERLLEWPVAGGPSAICVSRYNSEKVHEAYKLLKKLKWTGYAMVEYKGDHLIEINPRFWGSMPLLFIAKSHFFKNYIKILDNIHDNIDVTVIPYRLDKIMYFFPQAVLGVIALVMKGRPGKALKSLIDIVIGREGIFSFKNPVPFINYMKSLVRRNKR